MSNGIQIKIALTRHSGWELMMDVIRVTLTIVMRYITIEKRRDINDDLIMNVKM